MNRLNQMLYEAHEGIATSHVIYDDFTVKAFERYRKN